MRFPRQHDEKHLEFIRRLACIVCGNPHETEACHIRYSDARIGKNNPGVGAKPDDMFTLPMCGDHHRLQHEGNEKLFWFDRGLDPVLYALALYAVSGDHERASRIVASANAAVETVSA